MSLSFLKPCLTNFFLDP